MQKRFRGSRNNLVELKKKKNPENRVYKKSHTQTTRAWMAAL